MLQNKSRRNYSCESQLKQKPCKNLQGFFCSDITLQIEHYIIVTNQTRNKKWREREMPEKEKETKKVSAEEEKLLLIRSLISNSWKEILALHKMQSFSESDYDALYERVNQEYVLSVPLEIRNTTTYLGQMIMQEAASILKK